MIGGKSKGFSGSADQAIPQNPAALRGRVLRFEHGLRFPGKQRPQRIGRNNCPAANANGAEAGSGDEIVDRTSAEARRLASFPDAVAEFGSTVLVHIHLDFSG